MKGTLCNINICAASARASSYYISLGFWPFHVRVLTGVEINDRRFKQAEISLETHTQRLTGLTEIKLFSWLLLKAWKTVL